MLLPVIDVPFLCRAGRAKESSNVYVRMMYLANPLFILLPMDALCLLYSVWAIM